MPLAIRYKDTRNQHEVQCDDIQTNVITRIVKSYMLYPSDFDLMYVDLSDEIEEVICYQVGEKGRRICSFGGAQAWNIYRAIATIWPEINYHTSGRPAVIL